MDYLNRFRKRLERGWRASLISVAEARAIDPNAKKYLSQLAGKGRIEKVSWGWYWVPGNCRDFFDFMARDKHFKVLQKQSAASLWNGDFIHRDSFTVAVCERSYARALKSFASSRGWNVEVETRRFKRAQYQGMQGLPVESLEDTIVDCIKEWAFADAFASVLRNFNAIDWDRISRHYWERIPRSNVRVGQILRYGTATLRRATHDPDCRPTRTRITDDFVRRQVVEAAERVVDLA